MAWIRHRDRCEAAVGREAVLDLSPGLSALDLSLFQSGHNRPHNPGLKPWADVCALLSERVRQTAIGRASLANYRVNAMFALVVNQGNRRAIHRCSIQRHF